MGTFKYFNSTNDELTRIQPIPVAQFIAIGGIKSKHNAYDSFHRFAGYFNGQLFPVTRKIDYKKNPSLHKCDSRCQNATGHICECSCGGKHHGENNC
jgi:hypothetical protein